MVHRIIFYCILLSSSVYTLQPGDLCKTKTGVSGICKPLKTCQKALQDLKNNIAPTTCGYEEKQPVICCEETAKPRRPIGDIAKEKCQEYAKAVFQETWIFAGKVVEDVCGLKAGELVIGGEEAKPAEFPHQALLGYGEDNNSPPNPPEWLSGGSLISENYVLTAAHCRTSPGKGSAQVVRLGELDYSRRNDSAEPVDFKIAQFISHPGYRPPQRYNDIALIKLDRPAKFGKYIRPACIHTDFVIPPTRSESSIQRFIASGFGQTKQGLESSKSSALRKVTIDFFDQYECTKAFRTTTRRILFRGIDESSQLCAGGRNAEKDTCQGDSGGPLVTYHLEKNLYCMYRLVGVTSFGLGCGVENEPGIYTRVSHYTDWIERIVWL